MNTKSPVSLYYKQIEEKKIKYDSSQENVIHYLNNIYHQFNSMQNEVNNNSSNIFIKFSYYFFKIYRGKKNYKFIKGLYIWGHSGSGKTLLMDLFYHSLPGNRKLRLHFYRFMEKIHKEMSSLYGYKNPLQIIADKFKTNIDIICFDEFFISDIVDAILLGTLVKELFIRNIILVITSNISPDYLYFNGFQRNRFLPAIKLIKNYCDIINLHTNFDYRLYEISPSSNKFWFTPLGYFSEQKMISIFRALSGDKNFQKTTNIVLKINHRKLSVFGCYNGVLFVDFSELCESNRNSKDYIVLSNTFHSVLLANVKQMDNSHENTARRFLTLVDEFYDCDVRLIVSSSVSILELYKGSALKFEYRRCLSRLQEMQKTLCLELSHNI